MTGAVQDTQTGRLAHRTRLLLTVASRVIRGFQFSRGRNLTANVFASPALCCPRTRSAFLSGSSPRGKDILLAGRMSFTCKWGILATGWIAEQFTKDLLTDPSSRNVSDVKHHVAAVASSTSQTRAKEFVKKVGCPETTKCYGSYDELVNDPDIQVIYIATPHSHHYENALQCLNAGKSILCEKSFTVNAAQTKHLVDLARSKNLFAMEAVWIRCFPLAIELQRLLFEEKIVGRIRKVVTDFGVPFDHEDVKHRLLNPDLAGGALLDLGIYNLTWIRMTCFNDPRNEKTEAKCSSSMLMTEATGVDEFTNASFLFEKSRVNATMQCNMTVKSDKEAVVRIQGDLGDVTVQWPPYRPESFTIYRKEATDGAEVTRMSEPSSKGDKKSFEIPGHGMFWEADEVARCLRDGKLESSIVPLDESIATMTIMDTMRAQNGFRYSDKLEAVSN